MEEVSVQVFSARTCWQVRPAPIIQVLTCAGNCLKCARVCRRLCKNAANEAGVLVVAGQHVLESGTGTVS